MNTKNILGSLFTVATICAMLSQVQNTQAKQGATDPIPGTSKGGVSTGGGGGGKGGSSTPAPAPAPAPVQPIITAPLTFSSSGAVAGNCTGSYRIDPYYPTLSLLTVTVQVSSMNMPDYSTLSVDVATAGGTVYPFTSNLISVVAQSGSVSYSLYVTPGTTVAGVVVKDSAGTIDFAGN